MPLSEHEQRLLEEMERSLYHNEADVVSTAGIGGRAPNYRAIAVGVIMGVIGLGVMLTGVMTNLTVVGIIGFLVLFSGAMVAVAIPGKPAAGQSANSPSSSSGSKSLMDQLNERWERRQSGQAD
jgi:hypothetical protein